MILTTKDAIKYVLKHDSDANQYRLSKALECSHASIKNYLEGKSRMREDIYSKFKELYPSIEISDVWIKPKYKLGRIKECK